MTRTIRPGSAPRPSCPVRGPALKPHPTRPHDHPDLLLRGAFALHHDRTAGAGQLDLDTPRGGHGDDLACKAVRDAEEVGDEGVLGVREDFPRRALPQDLALAHDDHVIGQRHGLGLIMGHVYRGQTEPLLNVAQLEAHRLAQPGIEIGQRLVEEEHARAVDQRAGEHDPLLLSPAQL